MKYAQALTVNKPTMKKFLKNSVVQGRRLTVGPAIQV